MKTNYPNILVFATGAPNWGEGGSGFEMMVNATRAKPPALNATICGVVSNYSAGGVAERADRLGVKFRFWKGPFTAEGYQKYVEQFKADFVMLSGWLKLVAGLDPARTINIHPGPLTRFGGPNMYGHHVHEAVMAAYKRGEITHSAVTMHFVDSKYDTGPVFLSYPVPICSGDTPEILAARVNREEHRLQSHVLDHVVQGHVRLEGGKVVYATRDLRGMMMPNGYDENIHVVAA